MKKEDTYEDIINLPPCDCSKLHPLMDLTRRAAQFQPFIPVKREDFGMPNRDEKPSNLPPKHF